MTAAVRRSIGSAATVGPRGGTHSDEGKQMAQGRSEQRNLRRSSARALSVVLLAMTLAWGAVAAYAAPGSTNQPKKAKITQEDRQAAAKRAKAAGPPCPPWASPRCRCPTRRRATSPSRTTRTARSGSPRRRRRSSAIRASRGGYLERHGHERARDQHRGAAARRDALGVRDLRHAGRGGQFHAYVLRPHRDGQRVQRRVRQRSCSPVRTCSPERRRPSR